VYLAILISFGILLIWAAVVGVVSTALQLSNAGAVGISVILLLLTSIWAGFDAHKIEFKKYKTSLGSTIHGGVGVFAGVLALWIIFFPWYLYSRGKILSGRAEPKYKYKDTITIMKNNRKKINSGLWGLGIITVGLIFFCLFFRVVILTNDFKIVAKKHPTFSNTFVNLDDLLKRYNKAIEKYNSERFDPARRPLETYLREQALDPALYEEFCEKGLIVPKEEDIANK